jgi:predicted MFS family arabinose efflux permease
MSMWQRNYLGSSVGLLLGGVVADPFGYRAAFWVTAGLGLRPNFLRGGYL